ncbi:hypothetical protein Lal_00026147 [Lupinus albus]|nr:hypothetical protein Lal_00026147 [Lupinus albus]
MNLPTLPYSAASIVKPPSFTTSRKLDCASGISVESPSQRVLLVKLFPISKRYSSLLVLCSASLSSRSSPMYSQIKLPEGMEFRDLTPHPLVLISSLPSKQAQVDLGFFADETYKPASHVAPYPANTTQPDIVHHKPMSWPFCPSIHSHDSFRHYCSSKQDCPAQASDLQVLYRSSSHFHPALCSSLLRRRALRPHKGGKSLTAESFLRGAYLVVIAFSMQSLEPDTLPLQQDFKPPDKATPPTGEGDFGIKDTHFTEFAIPINPDRHLPKEDHPHDEKQLLDLHSSNKSQLFRDSSDYSQLFGQGSTLYPP